MPTTLRLWQFLHSAPATGEFRKLLRLDQPQKGTTKWNWLAGIVLLILLPFSTLMALPLIINFLCLHRALQISTAIANQAMLKRYDLLALTPMTGEGLTLYIARAYCYSMTTSLRSLVNVWGFAVLGMTAMMFLFETNLGYVFVAAATVALMVGALFIDYLQSVSGAVVIGILSGLSPEVFKARMITLGAFIGVQLLCYGTLIIALLIILSPFTSISSETALLLFATALVLIFTLREGVILVVWRLIRERTNDDLPILIP